MGTFGLGTLAFVLVVVILVIYWLTEKPTPKQYDSWQRRSRRPKMVDAKPQFSGVVRLEPPKVIGTINPYVCKWGCDRVTANLTGTCSQCQATEKLPYNTPAEESASPFEPHEGSPSVAEDSMEHAISKSHRD